MNPYEELDVPTDASDDEIKVAFREIARETHPDSADKPDPDRQIRAGAASRLLLDHKKRRRYDRTGNAETAEAPDNADAEALGLIASFINSITAQYLASFDPRIDPRRSEIMTAFVEQVSEGITDLEVDRIKAQRALVFLRDMEDRFEKGSKLQLMMRDRIRAQEGYIDEIDKARVLQTRAIKIARKVKFRFDVYDETERHGIMMIEL